MQLLGIRAAVFDFDKTVAETFEPSPSGLGVEEAYDRAVGEVLGGEGQIIYRQCGLKNRAPTELARDILLKADLKAVLIAQAQRYLRENGTMLFGLVPEKKGLTMEWSDEDPLPLIGELLARAKLKALVDEIRCSEGRIWPRPCEGVLDFMDDLRRRDIPVAILSSGHELFIKKTFELWGGKAPEMLTDDDLRGLSVSVDMRMKPHPYLFSCLIEKWAQVEKRAGSFVDRQGLFYFGDDMIKDGGLAANAGLRFGWYDPSGKKDVSMPANQFRFSCWSELLTHL